MRVITGTARGRKLTAPEGMDVRPTTDMAKEGMFSAIQFEIEGALALDLFAGSGQLGIEAMCRGARGAVFVVQSRASRQATPRGSSSPAGSSSTWRFWTRPMTRV